MNATYSLSTSFSVVTVLSLPENTQPVAAPTPRRSASVR